MTICPGTTFQVQYRTRRNQIKKRSFWNIACSRTRTFCQRQISTRHQKSRFGTNKAKNETRFRLLRCRILQLLQEPYKQILVRVVWNERVVSTSFQLLLKVGVDPSELSHSQQTNGNSSGLVSGLLFWKPASSSSLVLPVASQLNGDLRLCPFGILLLVRCFSTVTYLHVIFKSIHVPKTQH